MANSDPIGSGVDTCGGALSDGSSAFDNGGPEKENKKKKSWIAVKLVYENRKPIPHEEFNMTLPDGSGIEDDLDSKGLTREKGIDPGTCSVTFNHFYDKVKKALVPKKLPDAKEDAAK